jgi:RNA polymerase sigma-70 factor, ECF subfamily
MTRLVEDRVLLDAFRRGERAALAEVYREYARALFGFLAGGFAFESGGKSSFFKGLAQPWAREEAVQEIFSRAFSPAARLAYDGLRPYRNYLFTIARNYVLDLLRTGDRETLVSDPPEDGSAAPSPGSDEHSVSKELSAHCEAFVASLDPDERALFEVRFRKGLSIAQTAQQLGITEHRAKRTEARLRKRFFVQMKEHGYFEGFGYGKSGLRRLSLLLVLLLGAPA